MSRNNTNINNHLLSKNINNKTSHNIISNIDNMKKQLNMNITDKDNNYNLNLQPNILKNINVNENNNNYINQVNNIDKAYKNSNTLYSIYYNEFKSKKNINTNILICNNHTTINNNVSFNINCIKCGLINHSLQTNRNYYSNYTNNNTIISSEHILTNNSKNPYNNVINPINTYINNLNINSYCIKTIKPFKYNYNLEIPILKLIDDSKKINLKVKINLKQEYLLIRPQIIDFLKYISIKNNTSFSTYILSLYYVDLLMQNYEDLNQSLCVISCFLLAAKFNEKDPYIQSVHDFKSQNKKRYFTNNEVKRYETICLIMLDYNLGITTAYNILESFIVCGFLFEDEVTNNIDKFIDFYIKENNGGNKNKSLNNFDNKSIIINQVLEYIYEKTFYLLEQVSYLSCYINYHSLTLACSIICIIRKHLFDIICINKNSYNNFNTWENLCSYVYLIDKDSFKECKDTLSYQIKSNNIIIFKSVFNIDRNKVKFNNSINLNSTEYVSNKSMAYDFKNENIQSSYTSNIEKYSNSSNILNSNVNNKHSLSGINNNINSRNKEVFKNNNNLVNKTCIYTKPKPQKTIYYEAEEEVSPIKNDDLFIDTLNMNKNKQKYEVVNNLNTVTNSKSKQILNISKNSSSISNYNKLKSERYSTVLKSNINMNNYNNNNQTINSFLTSNQKNINLSKELNNNISTNTTYKKINNIGIRKPIINIYNKLTIINDNNKPVDNKYNKIKSNNIDNIKSNELSRNIIRPIKVHLNNNNTINIDSSINNNDRLLTDLNTTHKDSSKLCINGLSAYNYKKESLLNSNYHDKLKSNIDYNCNKYLHTSENSFKKDNNNNNYLNNITKYGSRNGVINKEIGCTKSYVNSVNNNKDSIYTKSINQNISNISNFNNSKVSKKQLENKPNNSIINTQKIEKINLNFNFNISNNNINNINCNKTKLYNENQDIKPSNLLLAKNKLDINNNINNNYINKSNTNINYIKSKLSKK